MASPVVDYCGCGVQMSGHRCLLLLLGLVMLTGQFVGCMSLPTGEEVPREPAEQMRDIGDDGINPVSTPGSN